MKERPMLMSSPMIRALLAGQKTQTRRVVKRHGRDCGDSVTATPGTGYDEALVRREFRCPYGKPGDRLWVRETWSAQYDFPTEYRGSRMAWYHDTPPAWRLPSNAMRTYYRADRSMYDVYDLGEPLGIDLVRHHSHGEAPRWVPSILMPRWASRIALEVADVRVERVQEISIDDVLAEGVERDNDDANGGQYWREATGARFIALWDSINGKRGYGWGVNPWVWAVSFRALDSETRGEG